MSYTNRGFDCNQDGEGGVKQTNDCKMKQQHSTPPPDYDKVVQDHPNIYVIGSGDFGRALAGRLAKSGYEVTIASRDAARNSDLLPSGVRLSGLSEVGSADVVIVAIPFDFYNTLPAGLLAGKVVVDVSNRNSVKRNGDLSQAEQLAQLLPQSKVVKSFNVLSAYSLESGGLQGSKQVYVAGDDKEAREVVSSIIRGSGFTPVDMGVLSASRNIEDIPVSVFASWRTPFYIHLAIFIFLYLLSFAKMMICWPITWSGDGSFLWHMWNQIPMDMVNKTLAVHALQTLAICYFPGVLAGWIQIFRGTKYSRFPNWLDNWLKMRKQLGLLMLFAASIHACLSLGYMGADYHGLAFKKDQKMDWQGECFLMSGVFGFALVVILGISSLPSVSASLTWKEFAFIQSGLGWVAMTVLCAHDMFFGWKYINGPSCGIPSSFQYALYVPLLTILLKIPLIIPPLSTHLYKIRAGYVRSKKRTSSNNVENI